MAPALANTSSSSGSSGSSGSSSSPVPRAPSASPALPAVLFVGLVTLASGLLARARARARDAAAAAGRGSSGAGSPAAPGAVAAAAGPAPPLHESLPPLVRAFLREQYGAIDRGLPRVIEAIKATGAAEQWHKHSTFLDHLLGVYRISRLWALPREVCLCALLHSGYSNSYVSLTLFKPDADGRARVRALAGPEAEHWTWLFCRVPRHELVYTRLVDPLVYGIGTAPGEAAAAADSGPSAAAGGAPGAALPTRQSLLGWRDAPPAYAFPAGGVTVADIRSAEPIQLDAYTVGMLLALSIADFCEQWHSWQDSMFETEADGGGRMRYAGKRAHVLWPGAGKPGLYLHTLSHVGRLVVAANEALEAAGDARRVPVPPVFDGCSRVVSVSEQRTARDAYWAATTELAGPDTQAEAEASLRACVAACPFVAEPHVLLSQLALQQGRWAEALASASEGLRLLCLWGTVWDKRMPYGAWAAWARCCAQAAGERKWPAADAPFGMINLGLVGRK